MWWLFALLLLLVVLFPLFWAIYRVSRLSFADPRGQIVDPEQVPESVVNRLKSQVEPLIGAGFQYLGMRQEERDSVGYWQAFLSSAGGMVWAVAEESDKEGEGRRVSLMSFCSDGSVAITRDGDFGFGEEASGLAQRSDSFSSALNQAENHAALLIEKEVSVAPIEPDVFLGRYERLRSQSLDRFFERGWLYEGRSRELKIPAAKLPFVALAWLKHQRAQKKRVKNGSSWLLSKNFGTGLFATEREEFVEEEVESDRIQEQELSEEVANSELRDEHSNNESKEDAEELEGAVAAALAANEAASQKSQVAAMPVGPIDGPLSESEVFGEQFEEAVHEEIASEPEPVIEIPEEDGLARDWALYQKQASSKSWGYWFGGFGGRAFLFLSLLAFSLWMVFSKGWDLRIVAFGVVALLVHEGGHALVMLLRRSWDWSHFLIQVPRSMVAKQWPIQGGWVELSIILAGPLPGLVFGWLVLGKAYMGNPTSDFMLDFALAAVVVNGFTLLPFLPLDGGRILDLVILRQVPQLRSLGLFFSGLIFATLALFGLGVLGFVLALLMWVSIPAAVRRSKLLPWMRANAKEDKEQQVVTAFNISRERSQRKAFKGPGGIARIDELMGLGHASKLGFVGGLLALLVLAASLFAPFALPASSLAKNGQNLLKAQGEVASRAEEYLGPLRPVKSSSDTQGAAEAKADAIADLEHWEDQLSKEGGKSGNVFSDEIDLSSARTMKWRDAAHWIAESPRKRHPVAFEAVRALRSEAIRSADSGENMAAFRDLSVALRIIIECEPRYSLDAWNSWFELEREVLKEVEDVSSRYSLADSYVKWYEGALVQCPQPTPKKVAGLILAESQGYEALISQFGSRSLFSNLKEAGLGQRFLSMLKGVGDVVSVEALEGRVALAEVFAKSKSLKQASETLQASEQLPLELEEQLQRIEANYSFRQIAKSALKIKRVGIKGAAQDLKVLRENYGFTHRIDESDGRRSLKLSRLDPAGEVIEMEWLLQQ